jgi:hypothetical protein
MSAASDNRRARAAHDAPPATPPTIKIRIALILPPPIFPLRFSAFAENLYGFFQNQQKIKDSLENFKFLFPHPASNGKSQAGVMIGKSFYGFTIL